MRLYTTVSRIKGSRTRKAFWSWYVMLEGDFADGSKCCVYVTGHAPNETRADLDAGSALRCAERLLNGKLGLKSEVLS